MLFGLLAALPVLFLSPAPSWGDEFGDAREILAGRSGAVKKWDTSPEIAVVHAGGFDFQELHEVIQFVNSHTGLAIDTRVRKKDLRSVGESLFGGTRLEHGRAQASRSAVARISFPDGETLSASVFVYKVDIASGALFLVLSRSAKGAWSLARQFVEGTSPCFFNVMSLDGEIRFAHIFIRGDVSEKVEKACIYEELVQAMGLLNDAPGSEFFTFDNAVEPKPDSLDWMLLRALYAKNVDAGGDVEAVLGNFTKLRMGLAPPWMDQGSEGGGDGSILFSPQSKRRK